jgi:hypothetical protein
MSFKPETQYSAFHDSKKNIFFTYFNPNVENSSLDVPKFKIDGKHYEPNWQPESILNNKLIEMNRIKSTSDYRKYMTENATQIMENNFKLYH